MQVLDWRTNDHLAVGAKDLEVALKDNPALLVLRGARNGLSDAGAKDLAAALKDNIACRCSTCV